MPRGSNQKFKLYRLAQIMMEQTDDEHYITMPEIIEELAKYDVTADRKSVYADLRDLSILGIEVEGEPIGNRYHYHVVSRAFELPELKLLVDAIQSSKFITEKKTNRLIKKLETLVSKYDAQKLQRQVFVSGRIKTMNESIYYTVDNSEPTKNSTLYDGEITIDSEETVVKAIAVNEIGVCSDVAEFKFKINYLTPEGPVFDEIKAEMEVGSVIKITNLNEGDTAYYTLDGTTPTKDSALYEDGIKLSDEGNVVVSAVIISKHGKSSQIVRRSITVKAAKTYEYAEAKGFLIDRMQALGVLKNDGKTLTSGGTISIIYQAKETVDGNEMYCVRVDVTKNNKTEVYGYYGIGIKDGKCYKVTGSSDSYKAVEY